MTTRRSFAATLRAYRWPLFLSGLMAMTVTAQSVLVFIATRPDAPRPAEGFYERSRRWDEDEAVRASSSELGWTVRFEVGHGPEQLAGMPRPIDVRVRDRSNRPVSGLTAELVTARPANPALDARVKLVELPHEAGRYRGLARLDAPGLWRFALDAERDGLHFVYDQRVTLPDYAAEEAKE